MTENRRRLLQYFALTAAYSPLTTAQDPATTMEALRQVATSHGVNLTDARLLVLKPVLEQRKAQLRMLRDFQIDDAITPTHSLPVPTYGRN